MLRIAALKINMDFEASVECGIQGKGGIGGSSAVYIKNPVTRYNETPIFLTILMGVEC